MTAIPSESQCRTSNAEQERLLCLLSSYEAYGGRAPWPECFESLTQDKGTS
jgi:hypothetical protein